MRISFSTATYVQFPLGFSLRLARDLGFDGVEWDVSPGYLLRGLAEVQATFAAAGVRPLSIHPPLLPWLGWPRRYVRSAPRLGALARRLGAELFVLHLPELASLDSPRARAYIDAIERGQLAGGSRVAVAIENLQFDRRGRRYPVDDLATVARFCQDHGCGLTFDTCHAGANGEDVLADYAIVKPVLRNIHLSDVVWSGGLAHTHRLPGEGELPLAELLRTLTRDGYDGLVTIEVRPDQAGPTGRGHAERRLSQALEFVRRHTAGRAADTGANTVEEPADPSSRPSE
ncbi:MAG TPA: sugar phosphate isomerase/epimerase family protein [Ktedonobacterales bacterium]